MRRLGIRIFVALITFLIGVTISSLWFGINSQPAQPFRLLSGPPCRKGVVSVESQRDSPLRITISDTSCRDSQTANVQFVVENLSGKPISKYEIRGLLRYDQVIDNGLGVRAETVEPLQPGQTQIGFLGGGVLKLAGGKPVSELRGFKLSVWSIDYADGTNWTRAFFRELR